MIIKDYTFSDIHKLLVGKKFECIFKIKCHLEKVLYIYIKKLSKIFNYEKKVALIFEQVKMALIWLNCY